MIWTHFYDMIVKIGMLFLSIFILIHIPVIENNVALLFALSVTLTSITYIFFLRTLSSIIYCKFTLNMNVNFKEAKKLNPALAPNPFSLNGLKWLPLKEIKTIDPNLKYETALKLMNNWLINNNKKGFKMKDSNKIKILEYSVVIVFFLFILTSYFNLPPSTYFIAFYCKIFNTQNYYPMLIASLSTLLYAIPIYFIKKKIGSNNDQ